MDLLKREIAKKKAALGGRTWARQAELAAARERDVEAAALSKRRKVTQTSTSSSSSSSSANNNEKTTSAAKKTVSSSSEEDEKKKTKEATETTSEDDEKPKRKEVIARLRALGLPATLFAETDDMRRARLAAALNDNDNNEDTSEFQLSGAYAFRRPSDEKRPSTEGAVEDDEDEEEEEEEDEPAEVKVPKRESKTIRAWIRRHLKAWARQLDARPEAEKRAPLGRVETKTYKQCKDYIRPLVKLCKRHVLDPSMRRALATIVSLADRGEFVKAHDQYILIAIGNAAWPIGVTSVGIHTRTAREQVEQKNVAHVMNNEMQRKYLTSVKRLLRFAQDQRPDLPPSQKVT